MRSFHIPKALLSTQVNAVANRNRINTLKNKSLENLQVFFNVFRLFSNLQFGLNPEAWRSENEKLKRIKQDQNKSFSNILAFTKQLTQHTKGYKWRKQCYEKLSKKEFWTSIPEDLQTKKREWLKISAFSYYSSSDIGYLAFNTLQCIENYILRAESEIKDTVSKNRNGDLKLFSEFLADTRNKLQTHRENMAKAMQARLQLAAKRFDLSYDDVMLDFIEELSTEYDTISRPKYIDRPNKQLSRNYFLRFHHYINRYGTEETKAAFEKLPWIQEGVYYKNKSGNWISRPFSLNKRTSIPKKPRWARWLFKGQYARYQAFGDPYHQIALYMQHQHAKNLCKQKLEKLDSNSLSQLQRIYHATTMEQKRLRRLTKPLNRLFQRKTIKILRSQITLYMQKRREILTKQCDLLASTIQIGNKKISEKKLIQANRLLQTINTIDKSDFPDIEKRVLHLSNKLKQISNEYFQRIIPVQYRIAEEIALYVANEDSSIPSLAVTMDAFDFKLFKPHTICTILKVIEMLLKDNTTFPKTAEQIQILKCLRNVFTYHEGENDRIIIDNFIRQQLRSASIETQDTNKTIITPPRPENDFINAIENNQQALLKQWKPGRLLTKLQDYLRYLLNPNCKDTHYLDKLDRLKSFTHTLENADWNKSIKRLCTAKTKINNITNELPEAIIALSTGETYRMPLLNELLIDIIDADLVTEKGKHTVIQLLDILTAGNNSNYGRLDPNLKLALSSLKKLAAGTATQSDRDIITKYPLQLQKSKHFIFWHTEKITHEISATECEQRSFELLTQ